MEYEPPIPGNPGGMLIDLEIQKIELGAKEAEQKAYLYGFGGMIIMAAGYIISSIASREDNGMLTNWDIAAIGGFLLGSFFLLSAGGKLIENYHHWKKADGLRTRYATLLAEAPPKRR